MSPIVKAPDRTVSVSELNGANCKTYLLCCGNEAILVDPVRERVPSHQKELAKRGATLRFVLETHTHADHLMLNREQKAEFGAPWIMHKQSPSPLIDRHVDAGEVLRLGANEIVVLHTPGHTPDSVSFYVPAARAVLTGDTLLIGGSGRTDFPGGDAGAQYDAVTKQLFTLPDDTQVFPAHDYRGNVSSTVAAERHENPRFKGRSREDYIEVMANLGLPFPEQIQQSLQVNQSGFEQSEVVFPAVHDIAAVPAVRAVELEREIASAHPPLLLDVREPEEFVAEFGHIRGAHLVPLDLLCTRLPKLAGYVEREIVVICRSGVRSASAGALLRGAGFRRVRNLEGGMIAWNDAGYPVQF